MPADWIAGAIGGAIIGLAALLYLLVNGRIMGASGILGGFVTAQGALAERGSFIAGLILVPGAIAWFQGGSATNATTNIAILIVAGLCVGIGTRMANGCTSGHGVCGISRLSLRGIAATMAYLLAGAFTVALARQVWGIL